MDLKLVKNLLNLISESDVDEVSIEEGDFKIKIKKKSESDQAVSLHYPAPPPPGVSPQAGQVQSELPESKPATAGKNQPAPDEDIIRSPIVGTFYRASSPESGPFVETGTKVEKGDTICIIEAMKIMNEIEAEYSGIIQEVLVENAQPVEYDQPLFIIKKN